MRRSKRFGGRWAAVGLIAFVAAGCSSDAGSSTATPDVSGPAATSPGLATSTTTAVALGPVGPAPTIVGQTTVAVTSPAGLDPAVEKAVKKAVQDFFAAYMACGMAPADCHPTDFHSSRGTAVGQGTVYFQGMATRGEYFSSDLRGSYIVTESVALDDPTSAITFSCWYDASIVLGPPDAAGKATVLNDKVISVREKQALYFDGTAWKVGEAATVQDLGDGNHCPPPDSSA